MNILRTALLVTAIAVPWVAAAADDPCTVDMTRAGLVGPIAAEVETAGLPGFDQTDTTMSWYGVHNITDELYVAIGPDGVVRGTLPATIREDAAIVVAVFHPQDQDYDVQITGCGHTTIRTLGTTESAGTGSDASGLRMDALIKASKTPYIATLHALGHCSADAQVSIVVQVAGSGCTTKSMTSTFQTSPVYNLTVGYGIGFFQGSHTTVGVDVGAGGQPNTAYARTDRRGLSDRLLLGWFPFGYAPALDLFEHTQGQSPVLNFFRHAFVGTFIDVSNPRDSLNLNLGVEVVQGLSLFAGLDFCEREKQLGGGLKNGSVFSDDSSTLPTTDSFDCSTHPYFGVAATIDLLAKLFPK